MRKLSESVWGDLRKKSLGQEERLEDSTNIRFMKPVDLGGSILWADRDLEQQGKDVFTYKEVEELLSRTEWRLPTSEEAKELFCPGKYEENGYSFSNGNQELLFKKRRYEYHSGESYIGWTSTVMGTMLSNKYNRMGVFVMEDGNTSQDDFILTSNETSHYSARLVKDLPNTNESVWGDMRKKSLGQEDRIEDDVNLLSREEFINYLKNTYVPVPPNPPTLNRVLNFKNTWSNHLSFYFIDADITSWSSYPLMLVYNKDDEIVGMNIKPSMSDHHGIFEYIKDNFNIHKTLNNEYSLIPKDESPITNKTFVDLIDACLERIEPPYKSAIRKERK